MNRTACLIPVMSFFSLVAFNIWALVHWAVGIVNT